MQQMCHYPGMHIIALVAESCCHGPWQAMLRPAGAVWGLTRYLAYSAGRRMRIVSAGRAGSAAAGLSSDCKYFQAAQLVTKIGRE